MSTGIFVSVWMTPKATLPRRAADKCAFPMGAYHDKVGLLLLRFFYDLFNGVAVPDHRISS